MATRRSVETSPSSESRTRSVPAAGNRPASAKPTARARVSVEDRRAMIAEAAYLRAERRGFTPGKEEEDWLAAEEEVDALLELGPRGSAQ
jgi:hypothetical protein